MTTTLQFQNGDVVLGATGVPHTVTGTAKLEQDLAEMLSSNAAEIGAGLDAMIGSLGDPQAIRILIARRIRDAVERLKRAQRRNGYAQRSVDERLARIVGVTVQQRDGSLTSFVYRLVVVTEAGARVEIGGAVQ